MNKKIPTKRFAILKLLITCLLFNSFQNCPAQNSSSSINTIPNDGNPFDGKAMYNRQKTQIIYLQQELLAKGFIAGSAIDTLCFEIKSRNTVSAYNLILSYYYTNSNFMYAFPLPLNYTAPIVVPGGTVFTWQVDLSSIGQYYVSPSGGTLKIPLSTPIIWSGSTTSLVIQVCWNSPFDMLTDSVITLQKFGFNYFSRIRMHSNTITACSLNDSTAGTIKNASDWRPDLLCGTSTLGIHSIERNNGLNVISLDNKLQIQLISPQNLSCSYTINDAVGRTILKGQTQKTKTGESTFEIDHHLIKGIYLIRLFNSSSQFSKLFFVL